MHPWDDQKQALSDRLRRIIIFALGGEKEKKLRSAATVFVYNLDTHLRIGEVAEVYTGKYVASSFGQIADVARFDELPEHVSARWTNENEDPDEALNGGDNMALLRFPAEPGGQDGAIAKEQKKVPALYRAGHTELVLLEENIWWPAFNIIDVGLLVHVDELMAGAFIKGMANAYVIAGAQRDGTVEKLPRAEWRASLGVRSS